MATETSHASRIPGYDTILRRQLLLVARLARWELFLISTLILLVFAGWTYGMLRAPDDVVPILLAGLVLSQTLALVLAALWTLGVWKDEGPRDRSYHWALPVDRGIHDLARVTAGAAWMLAGIALFLVLTSGALLAGGAGEVLASFPPEYWANYITGPLTAYLLASVAGILVDRPGRWIVATPLAWVVATSMLQVVPGARPAAEAMAAVVAGPYGLGPALTGGVRRGPARVAMDSGMESPWELGAWLPGAALWLVIALVAVWAASRVHREV